ncbi:MAG: cobalt transporter CbiM [Geminicoccaceae bacterium]|nr:MAG: cobalt transporter CbiM [Geminicoccaceae bacterium]
MHIPDGILGPAVTLAGYAGTAAVMAVCLGQIAKRDDPRRDVPKAAMLTAAFFVASLVHVPIPPTSVHLMLNGLLGVVLGWFAFPAIVVGLFFQAVMFGHGGLTTLGVNALVLGLPSLLAFALFSARHRLLPAAPWSDAAVGFVAGAGAVAAAVVLVAVVVLAGLPAHVDPDLERRAIQVFALAHVPLMVIEGVVVAMVLAFLRKASPELLLGR